MDIQVEEKYKQVNDIIANLVAENPYITKEQIAKAKSLYNGDARPIEEIEEELRAYSDVIMENGKRNEQAKESPIEQKEMPQDLETTKDEPSTTEQESNSIEEPEEIYEPLIGPFLEDPIPNDLLEENQEIYEPLRVELPQEKEQKELQSMIDDALNSSTEQPTYSAENTYINEPKQKVLVKENKPVNNTATNDEAGYGSATALLALTILCSIMTIVVSVFTLLAK